MLGSDPKFDYEARRGYPEPEPEPIHPVVAEMRRWALIALVFLLTIFLFFLTVIVVVTF